MKHKTISCSWNTGSLKIKEKIISGEFHYCQRTLKSWLLMGYRIAKAKRWSDGKYTYVLHSTNFESTNYMEAR